MTPEDNLRMEAVIKRGDEYLRRALKAEARLAKVVDLASLKIEYAADDQAGGWNAAMEAVLAAAQPEEEP